MAPLYSSRIAWAAHGCCIERQLERTRILGAGRIKKCSACSACTRKHQKIKDQLCCVIPACAKKKGYHLGQGRHDVENSLELQKPLMVRETSCGSYGSKSLDAIMDSRNRMTEKQNDGLQPSKS